MTSDLNSMARNNRPPLANARIRHIRTDRQPLCVTLRSLREFNAPRIYEYALNQRGQQRDPMKLGTDRISRTSVTHSNLGYQEVTPRLLPTGIRLLPSGQGSDSLLLASTASRISSSGGCVGAQLAE